MRDGLHVEVLQTPRAAGVFIASLPSALKRGRRSAAALTFDPEFDAALPLTLLIQKGAITALHFIEENIVTQTTANAAHDHTPIPDSPGFGLGVSVVRRKSSISPPACLTPRSPCWPLSIAAVFWKSGQT